MKLFICLLFTCNILFCQSLKPTDSEALVKLSISDLKNIPLSCNVTFVGFYSKKHFSFHTDNLGKLYILIPNNDTYTISIDASGTTFDYEILDLPEQTLELPLKFDTSTKPFINNDNIAKVNVFLYCINKPKNAEVLIKSIDNNITDSTKLDTINLFLNLNQEYKLSINGFTILNSKIKIDSFSNKPFYYIANIKNPDIVHLERISNKTVPFLINYIDIFSQLPANNQKITVISKKTKKEYTAVTSQNGTCLFLLPQDADYDISLSYRKNIFSISLDNSTDLKSVTYKVIYPTSDYFEKKRKDDSILIALRDLDYFKKYKNAETNNSKTLKEQLEDKAANIKNELEHDSLYFQKSGNVVCAVLHRMKDIWKSKMIVTDLTGSMYPYMNQLGIWFSLKMMTKEDNDYVFFNDGDGKPDYAKTIGTTGGIYYTDSDSSDIILDEITKTMRRGDGGDSPENDIEALLVAQEKMKKYAEVILIADNFSNVKDISYLYKLHIPIRIILCGSQNGINPDYIEIAYKTNGSLHTIEEDIMNLGKMVDGGSITLRGIKYLYSNGKFFKMYKS